MKKEKIMMRLSLDLETFQAHLKRLQRKDYDIHQLDVELLQEKTRDIYDQLFELANTLKKPLPFETVSIPEKETVINKEIKEDKAIVEEEPKAVKPEAAPVESISEPEQPIIEKPDAEPKNEMPLPPPEIIIEPKPEPIVQVEAPKPTPIVEVPKPIIPPAVQSPRMDIPEEKSKSTIDLFSDAAEATVSDQYTKHEEPSLAEKMQRANFTDLRQEIGINEKFLFINELFGGDLGRYNATIDDLNEQKTAAGINAYLIELKVSNQWQDENEAFQKLKTLLDRKLS